MKQLTTCIYLKKQIKDVRRKNKCKFWQLVWSKPEEVSWYEVSRNINIDLYHLKRCGKLAAENASRNPQLTYSFIECNSELIWDWEAISKTVDILNREDRRFVVDGLSKNPHLTVHYIQSHLNYGWNWKAISRCPNITVEFIQQFPSDYFDWNLLSSNSAITPNNIIQYPGWPWSYRFLSRNPNLTFDFVKNNLDRDWDWYYLSRHPNITIECVENNISLPWSYFGLSRNLSITCDFVKKHPHDRWNYYWLSKILHIDDIQKHFNEMHFVWAGISANLTITGEFILKYKHELNWHELSCNNSLDIDFILDNLSLPWDWVCLSCNRFDYGVKILEKGYREEIKKLAKEFYWKMITQMSKPPNGYYFRKDLQEMMQLSSSVVKKDNI